MRVDLAQELERRDPDVARQAAHDLDGLLVAERALEHVLGVADAALRDEVLRRRRTRRTPPSPGCFSSGDDLVEGGDLEHELVDLLLGAGAGRPRPTAAGPSASVMIAALRRGEIVGARRRRRPPRWLAEARRSRPALRSSRSASQPRSCRRDLLRALRGELLDRPCSRFLCTAASSASLGPVAPGQELLDLDRRRLERGQPARRRCCRAAPGASSASGARGRGRARKPMAAAACLA